MVTLAVKPEPETPKLVGEDEDPEHDVNVAIGVEIFRSDDEGIIIVVVIAE